MSVTVWIQINLTPLRNRIEMRKRTPSAQLPYIHLVNKTKAILNDIGTEELGHLEMVGAMVHQLLKNATPEDIKRAGAGDYFADHGYGVYPVSAAGVPWTAASIQSMGDPVADLNEDLAAEQKARATYENLIRLSDDPDVLDALRFLREREVVHYQRFGEALRIVEETLQRKKYY